MVPPLTAAKLSLIALVLITCLGGREALAQSSRTYTLSVTELGAIPDDDTDDSPAFQQALSDLGSTGAGGTILVPPGRFIISDEIASTTLTGKSVRFLGTGNDSVIVVNTPNQRTFYLANAETVTFEKLTFVPADPASVNDAAHVIRIDGAKLAAVRDCNFYGIATQDGSGRSSVIWFFSSFGVIERTGFYGTTSETAVVLFSNFRGAVARTLTFLDYGTHNEVGYSKIPLMGTAAWVEIRDPIASPQNAATNGSAAVIENVVADEGAAVHIVINPAAGGAGRRLHSAKLSNINGNVSGTIGLGVIANDVDLLDIQHSWFGYTGNSTQGLRLRGIRKATLYGVLFGQGVDRYDIDSTNTNVEIIASSASTLACAAQLCRVSDSYAGEGGSGNAGVDGGGTTGRLAKFIAPTTLGNSSIVDDASGTRLTAPTTFDSAATFQGPVNFNGNVNLGGGATLPVIFVNYDVILTAQHGVVLADATNAVPRREIYLPNPLTNVGKIFTVKKIDASTRTVRLESRTFSKNLANIDNGANHEITNQFGSRTVIAWGGHWWIIGKD